MFKTLIEGRMHTVTIEEQRQPPDWNDEYAVSEWFMRALAKIDPAYYPDVESAEKGDPAFDANAFAANSRRENELRIRLWIQKQKADGLWNSNG